MKDDNIRNREIRTDNVRVVPEFREQIDINKFCQALIEIAKSIANEKHSDLGNAPSDNS